MNPAPRQPTPDGAQSRDESPPSRYDGHESRDEEDNEPDEREERNGDGRQYAEDDEHRQPGIWIAQHRHRRSRESAATAFRLSDALRYGVRNAVSAASISSGAVSASQWPSREHDALHVVRGASSNLRRLLSKESPAEDSWGEHRRRPVPGNPDDAVKDMRLNSWSKKCERRRWTGVTSRGGDRDEREKRVPGQFSHRAACTRTRAPP
jgi:hypothetical protein